MEAVGSRGFVAASTNHGWWMVNDRGTFGEEREYGPEDLLAQARLTEGIFRRFDDPALPHLNRPEVSPIAFALIQAIMQSALERRRLDLPTAPVPDTVFDDLRCTPGARQTAVSLTDTSAAPTWSRLILWRPRPKFPLPAGWAERACIPLGELRPLLQAVSPVRDLSDIWRWVAAPSPLEAIETALSSLVGVEAEPPETGPAPSEQRRRLGVCGLSSRPPSFWRRHLAPPSASGSS